VEIVVTGRNVEVPDHFRVHVAEKVARLERYDHKIMGLEVELFHERNRRQLKTCQRVEITGRGSGRAARAEARAQDFYAALDAAVGKLEARLRRSHDRRRVTSRRARALVGRPAGTRTTLPGETPSPELGIPVPRSADHDRSPADPDPHRVDGAAPGRVVRSAANPEEPMTVDDALRRMELVGHDFYLFSDAASGEPSVVYRRKGYAYGVISLAR